MKAINLLTTSIFALTATSFRLAAAQNPKLDTVYLHGFRSPSIGAEARSGNWGLHAGLYTTILGLSGKSTEFLKVGVTNYFHSPIGKRFQSFASLAYVSGRNRDYRNSNGAFIEQGIIWDLGKNLELRTGSGLLLADGHRPKLNPTIGLTYRVRL